MKKIILTAVAFFVILSLCFSQDKIYRNNGKVVEAKILEIGSGEIKYREYNDPRGLIYVLETDRIKKIVFETGAVQTFEDNYKDPERYTGQLNKALKINFLSPLYGYFEIGFEKSKAVGKGYEFSLGIIGLGKSGTLEYSPSNNQWVSIKRGQRGAFVSSGYKFNKLPDFIIFGKTKMSHLMQGTYAKPILYLGHYSENRIVSKINTYSDEVKKQKVTFAAFQIEIGKQWVFNEKFLIDVYWGIGYGFDNKKDTYGYEGSSGYYDPFENTSAFNYANGRVGKSPGLSGTYGVKLGKPMK